MKSLEEMIRDLPPDAQRKVEDFVKEVDDASAEAEARPAMGRSIEALSRPIHVVAIATESARMAR